MEHTVKTGSMSKIVTAYDKDIDVTVDGVEMRVILHWDDHDGYEMTWLDSEGRFITSPDWISEVYEFCLKLDGANTHSEVKL